MIYLTILFKLLVDILFVRLENLLRISKSKISKKQLKEMYVEKLVLNLLTCNFRF